MKTETAQLKERDLFCVVSDAFRIFARRSSMLSEAPGPLPEPCLSSLSGLSPDQGFIFHEARKTIQEHA